MPKDIIEEIVVVNNGSTDDTARIAQQNGAVVLTENRRGYGWACLKGMEYLKEKDIEIVENLQEGESHRIHVPDDHIGPGFDVVVCYDGEEYEDTSYTFEREEHHLNWYEVSGRGDRYEDRY